jgi:diguanylate cyclase (GGDEF)-like protein
VLAVVVPSMALSVVGFGIIRERREAVRSTEDLRAEVEVIDQLIELRSALFAERIAWELRVPERVPPDAVLRGTAFGQRILDPSRPLEQATDRAIARLEPEDRPFDPAELERIRSTSAEWSRTPEAIRARLEPLSDRTEDLMLAHATGARDRAVDLGDNDLISAGTTFQRSLRLPDDAARIIATLSDLWAGPPDDRPILQSAVASEASRFATSSQIFASSLGDREGPVARFWNGPAQIPPSLQKLLLQASAGDLTPPERPVNEPPEVGLTLIDGIDWTIQMDEMPSVAAGVMIAEARDVAGDAKAAERAAGAVLAATVLLSVLTAALFGRSIVTPLRRLTRHAERLGRGDLDLHPLPPGGPPDVAAAAAAVNDVVGTLTLLEEKSRALAEIDLEAPALDEPLPGELGAALQRSTEVLAASIADREGLRAALQHDATHDHLTGLANRAALAQEIAVIDAANMGGASGGAAIVFIELDGYKQVRHRRGLGQSDELIRAMTGRVAELAPVSSTVGRLGDDDFVVLLTGDVTIDAADRLARTILDALAAPVEVADEVLQVRARAGVATLDEVSGSMPGPTDLLQRADLAVHHAEWAGGGAVVRYDDALARRIARDREVEAALSAALFPGVDELHVVYQPIVAAVTGDLCGLEALVRWERDGDRTGPDEFVRIAERSGLVVALDRWVLDAVARQMVLWAAHPLLAEVPVSVNVSGRTLLRPTLPGDIRATLAAHGIAPGRLVLEVTETALITDLDLAASQVQELRSVGVRVAIDDFGAGYTSIAHLRALQVDELKIDGSFIRDLPGSSERGLVQMIQDLAGLLDLATVAEGVETEAQAAALAAIGCGALQGFLFSPPVDADAVERWAAGRASGGRRSIG